MHLSSPRDQHYSGNLGFGTAQAPKPRVSSNGEDSFCWRRRGLNDLCWRSRYGALNTSLGVFVIDFFNQKVNGDFRMNLECFPNVSSLVTNVRQHTGTELMVSLWPFIEPGSLSRDAMQKQGCIASHNTVDATTSACRDFMWKKYIKPNYIDQGMNS